MKEGEGEAAKDTDISIVTLKEEAGFATIEEYNKSLEAVAEPVKVEEGEKKAEDKPAEAAPEAAPEMMA